MRASIISSGCQVFQIPIFTNSYWSGVFSFADEEFSIYSPNSDEFFRFSHFPGISQKLFSSLCQVLVNVDPCFDIVLYWFNNLWKFRRLQVEPSLVEVSLLSVRGESDDHGCDGRSLLMQSMYYVNIVKAYINWNLLTYFDENICQVLTFAFRYILNLDIKFPRILF